MFRGEAAQIGRREYWAGIWNSLHHKSTITSHQKSKPGVWLDFFSRIADVYLPMQGEPWTQGRVVTDFLMAQGLVTPQTTLLDVGAGPGGIAVPLAEHGVRVTTLDLAEGMTRVLSAETVRRGLANLDVRHGDWVDFHPASRFDMVLAAFFPPALSPEGLARMEGWAEQYCVLALSTGRPSFPFREVLAAELEDFPPPKDAADLACAFKLPAGGRPATQSAAFVLAHGLPAAPGYSGAFLPGILRHVRPGQALKTKPPSAGCCPALSKGTWWKPKAGPAWPCCGGSREVPGGQALTTGSDPKTGIHSQVKPSGNRSVNGGQGPPTRACSKDFQLPPFPIQ